MKIVYTADLQAHNHELYSRILPDGRNSRLVDALDCIRQAAALAEGGVLVLNGDITHDRRFLSIDVIDGVVETICEVSLDLHEVVINIGNHDQFLRNGTIHSLRGLEDRPGIKLVPRDGLIRTYREAKTQVYLFPFTTNTAEVRSFIAGATIHAYQDRSLAKHLVLHQPVQTADLGKGILSQSGLNVEDFSEVWDAVVLGHYHKPQQLFDRPIFYVGSPYQIDWNEAGDEKRYLLWDGEMQSVPVVGMPTFQHLTLEEYQALDVQSSLRDFIELEVDNLETARALALPENVLPVQRRTTVEISQGTMSLSNFSPHEAVAQWLAERDRADQTEKAYSRIP